MGQSGCPHASHALSNLIHRCIQSISRHLDCTPAACQTPSRALGRGSAGGRGPAPWHPVCWGECHGVLRTAFAPPGSSDENEAATTWGKRQDKEKQGIFCSNARVAVRPGWLPPRASRCGRSVQTPSPQPQAKGNL